MKLLKKNMSLGTLKLTISLLFFFVIPTLRAESIEGNSVTIQILDKITDTGEIEIEKHYIT